MKMIGYNDNSFDGEGAFMPDAADRAQKIDIGDQIALVPVPQGDREEIGGIGYASATIVHHART